MKKFAKATSLVLALSLTVLLAACGGATDGTTDTNGTNGTNGTTETNGTGSSNEEVVTLDYWTIGGEPGDLKLVNDAINEYTRDEIGVQVNFHYSDWGAYADQLTKMLNTQEKFDIAFGASISDYSTHAQNGLFADLKPALEGAAKDLYDYVPADLWTAMTLPDGSIYGVPAYKDSSMTQYLIFDKAMLEELDFAKEDFDSIPSLEPLLVAYKEANPDNYPLMMNQGGIDAMLSNYEPIAGRVVAKFGTTDAVNLYAEEDVVELFKLIREWNEKGYINPDANTLTEPVTAAQIFAAQGFPGADANWSGNQGFEVVSNPFFGPIYTNQSIQGSFTVVSAASANVAKAAEYLMLQNIDPVVRNLVAFGVEGTHYEKTGDTTIEKLEADERYSVPAYSQGTFFTMYTIDPNPADQWTLVKEQNEEAEGSPLLGFVFDPTPVEGQLAALSNISSKYHGTLMTGSADVDATLASMYSEQEAAGIEEVITEAQSQIDAWLSSKE